MLWKPAHAFTTRDCTAMLTCRPARARSFVDALLQNLPCLAAHPAGPSLSANGAGSMAGTLQVAEQSRGVFLRLLAQLLALAPQRVLSPASPAFKLILSSYVATLNLRRAPCHLACSQISRISLLLMRPWRKAKYGILVQVIL